MKLDDLARAVVSFERRVRETVPAAVLNRAISAFLFLATGTVLAIAAWLDPDPAGHGTHTQLGLGACSFLQLTGYACPMCGATTTFTLAAHLRPLEAVVNQPFAFFLFTITVGMFGVSLAELIQPRQRWTRILSRIAPWEGPLSTGFLIAMGLGWLYKIIMLGQLG